LLGFAVLLILGIGVRLVNLDRKVYWVDEVHTSLRMSGYTETELVEQVFTGAEWTVADLMTYQQPTPERGWGDTLSALQGNAEHAPLYFLLARAWAEWWGYSVATMRSLPVLFSLLVLPAVYWLCRELGLSPATTGIAMTLVALSPLHVLYAQEARQYSLWTLWIVLSSALLLWAWRSAQSQANQPKSWFPWLLYSLTVALGLYTHLLFALVILVHALYLALPIGFPNCGDRESKSTIGQVFQSFSNLPVNPPTNPAPTPSNLTTHNLQLITPNKPSQLTQLISPTLALLLALLLFTPWVRVIFSGLGEIQDTTAFLTEQYSLTRTIDFWFLNLNRVFVDRELGTANIILVGLAVYALVAVWREQAPRTRWFVLLLVGIPFLGLAVPDLVLGGQRSLRIRYLVPAFLGLQLAIAHLLAVRAFPKWHGRSQSFVSKTIWRAALVVLLSASLLACLESAQAKVWWTKSLPKSHYFPAVAEIINQTADPLIITDDDPIHLLSFTYLLAPETRLRPVLHPRQLPREQDLQDAFLFVPSDTLRQQLEQYGGYQAMPVYGDAREPYLWQLTNPNPPEATIPHP
jgi:uncharacterized membrane protein